MPYIQIPGLRIHYQTAGNGPNTLLLVHGNFASWRWWQPLLERLPADLHALAPDLRGCGDSEKPGSGYTIEQLAKDLAAFADALELSRFHLLGHSLGGAVALQLAIDGDERLQSLMLAAPAPAEGLSVSAQHQFDNLISLDNLYRWLPSLELERSFGEQILTRLYPDVQGGADLHALSEDALRTAPAAAAGFAHALAHWNVQAELEKIRVPTLIVGGGHDPLINPDALKRTAAGLPQARLVIWPDTGHNPLLEQPARFRTLLTDFLEHPE